MGNKPWIRAIHVIRGSIFYCERLLVVLFLLLLRLHIDPGRHVGAVLAFGGDRHVGAGGQAAQTAGHINGRQLLRFLPLRRLGDLGILGDRNRLILAVGGDRDLVRIGVRALDLATNDVRLG